MSLPRPVSVSPRTAWFALSAALVVSTSPAPAQDTPSPANPGLQATFASAADASRKDARVEDGALLFVPAGQPASAFLPAGPFTAVWEGFISVDLRDRYTFRVEAAGSFKVEINGEAVLEAKDSHGTPSEPSKRVRLGKGANPIKVSYHSPAAGDAFLRLFWSSPDFEFEPVPADAFTHASDDFLERSSLLRRGRGLFVERRCHKCHTAAVPTEGMLELSIDAPAFAGIGSRRNADWMKDWILNPTAFRHASAVRMPKVLGDDEKGAAAAAAYLATLKDSAPPAPSGGNAGEGGQLFSVLHCEACHQQPGAHDANDVKLSLNFVNRKFPAGALAAFLRAPQKHFAWIRMPDFRLSAAEAANLAAFLRGKASPSENPAPDAAETARGREIVETAGCLNCHAGPGQNRHVAPGELKNPAAGCLAESGGVHFELTTADRKALTAFVKAGADSLTRHVPAEFARRQIDNVGCANCHGKFDGFPKLDPLGGKLRPEWSEGFIAGRIEKKPRYWMPSRMPAFASRAAGLAHGMAAQHGYGPMSPDRPKVDPEMAAAGRKMVGTDGGFSCIACHAVKEFGAQQVFESAGINFGQVGGRLRKSFFQRWLMNPLRVDPSTKMPVYFAGGMSPLFDFYDGDAKKQIEAFWEYIRQGDAMPLPEEAGQ